MRRFFESDMVYPLDQWRDKGRGSMRIPATVTAMSTPVDLDEIQVKKFAHPLLGLPAGLLRPQLNFGVGPILGTLSTKEAVP